jgi:hypothetical protein
MLLKGFSRPFMSGSTKALNRSSPRPGQHEGHSYLLLFILARLADNPWNYVQTIGTCYIPRKVMKRQSAKNWNCVYFQYEGMISLSCPGLNAN